MKRLLLLATPVILALAGCAAQPPKNLDAPVVVKTATQGGAVIAAGIMVLRIVAGAFFRPLDPADSGGVEKVPIKL